MNRVRRIVEPVRFWLFGPENGDPKHTLIEQVDRAAIDLEKRVHVLKSLTARMHREESNNANRLAHGS